jgi:hypothetical protein
MTTEDGNKILTDFMGWEDAYHPTNQLHLLWDWLMPVVEKIEMIYIGDFVESHIFSPTWNKKIKHECFFWAGDEIRNITSTKSDSKIDAVWGACVKFIVYYEEKNKKH